MDPKFLVVEIDSKEQALQMVEVMLEKGFARLMLLDNLAKHPTLVRNQKEGFRETASSPIIFEDAEYQMDNERFIYPELLQEPSNSIGISAQVKQEPSTINPTEDEEAVEEEEEEMVLTSRRSNKRPYEEDETPEYREQLMNMLRGEPEIVPIGVNSSDKQSGSNSASKKPKNGEYHECQLCGVRVKTPRSGRWNLQMHVIALHCESRQYKCKECNFLDYRKSTMRKHTVAQHGSDIPPLNITTNAMRQEWHEAMQKCFPEFALRTGFL